MWRSILGAVVGYIAMVAVVMVGIGIAWGLLGGSGAFSGEGPYPSTAWLAFNLVFGFVGSVAGGWVALKTGKGGLAVRILVGLMLVLGLYMALTAESSYANREPVDKPVAEMTFMEAGQHAKQPTWYNWVIPLIGVAGVLIGGRERSAPGNSPTG